MNGRSNFNYLKMSFVFLVLFLSIIPHLLFYNNAQAQITGISSGPAGETSSKSSQSTLDSLVSPKSLMASVFGEVKNNNNTNTTKNTNLNGTQYANNLVGDSATILLSNQILPPKDYIHIYDSLPYKITNGHLTAKLPCDTDSKPVLRIFTGKIPVLKPSTLQVIKELSKPGYMCLYYLDIPPKNENELPQDKNSTDIVTDIVLYNPTSVKQVLLNTSSIVIGINEINPTGGQPYRNTTTSL
jgi:hypothetical protein